MHPLNRRINNITRYRYIHRDLQSILFRRTTQARAACCGLILFDNWNNEVGDQSKSWNLSVTHPALNSCYRWASRYSCTPESPGTTAGATTAPTCPAYSAAHGTRSSPGGHRATRSTYSPPRPLQSLPRPDHRPLQCPSSPAAFSLSLFCSPIRNNIFNL